jgi:hypothetical protein
MRPLWPEGGVTPAFPAANVEQQDAQSDKDMQISLYPP